MHTTHDPLVMTKATRLQSQWKLKWRTKNAAAFKRIRAVPLLDFPELSEHRVYVLKGSVCLISHLDNQIAWARANMTPEIPTEPNAWLQARQSPLPQWGQFFLTQRLAAQFLAVSSDISSQGTAPVHTATKFKQKDALTNSSKKWLETNCSLSSGNNGFKIENPVILRPKKSRGLLPS